VEAADGLIAAWFGIHEAFYRITGMRGPTATGETAPIGVTLMRLVLWVCRVPPQNSGIVGRWSQLTYVNVAPEKMLVFLNFREVADRIPNRWANVISIAICSEQPLWIHRCRKTASITQDKDSSPPLRDSKLSRIQYLNWFYDAIPAFFHLPNKIVQDILCVPQKDAFDIFYREI
jgi:hypothetical protein